MNTYIIIILFLESSKVNASYIFIGLIFIILVFTIYLSHRRNDGVHGY